MNHKRCATCGIPLTTKRKSVMTCSYTCSAIRRVKMYPHHVGMVKANIAYRDAVRKRLAVTLKGKSEYECYQLGYRQGYATCHQKQMRRERRAA